MYHMHLHTVYLYNLCNFHNKHRLFSSKACFLRDINSFLDIASTNFMCQKWINNVSSWTSRLVSTTQVLEKCTNCGTGCPPMFCPFRLGNGETPQGCATRSSGWSFSVFFLSHSRQILGCLPSSTQSQHLGFESRGWLQEYYLTGYNAVYFKVSRRFGGTYGFHIQC
jgi:hypothetical protein